jgi:hypothetical protein
MASYSCTSAWQAAGLAAASPARQTRSNSALTPRALSAMEGPPRDKALEAILGRARATAAA